MKAVIMAGGEGKRLRPITCTLPKPMVPLLNKPVIDYCIELLKKHGIEDITATLHYLPRVITSHCGSGEKYGVKLGYSVETVPLGTAGSVRKAVGDNPERTLVISGDAITDMDITDAVRAHENSGAAVTIVLKRVDVPTEYGVALKDKKGRIYRFLEKPMLSEVFSDLANTGIYILEKEVLERIPKDKPYDFSKDLFPTLLGDGLPIYGYVTDKYWCDIGDIRQYRAAQRDMLTGRCDFDTAAEKRNGIWIEPGAKISPKASVAGPCYIGRGAEIGAAVITDCTVIGSGVRIGDNSSAKRSVLMENVRVRENVELRGAVLCEGAEAESGASVFSNTVIGCGGRVGKNSTVSSGASVWPRKKVENEQHCCENVKWQEEERPSEGQVSGYTDTLLTPERAARIGGAFGASLGKLPVEAAIATDGSQQAVMLKYGVISGLCAQGVDAADMGCCGYSAFEHGIREFGYDGGMYIRCGAAPHKSEIVLCDGSGTELSPSGYRAFEQELKTGARQPLTWDRLGIVQRVNGAAKAYDAYLSRTLNSPKQADNSMNIIIGGSADVYDTAARVLLPRGYGVKYSGLGREALHTAVQEQKAHCGFYAENGVFEAVIKGKPVDDDRLTVALAVCAAEDGRINSTVMPAHMPPEYLKLISGMGIEVSLAPSKRSRWMRTTLEQKSYIPEFFEPEARIIRSAELLLCGRLEKRLEMLPDICRRQNEVKCSWKDIGRILRTLTDEIDRQNVELVDGVKVKADRGWILIKPDAALTACRIIAGSMDAEYSRELTDIYSDKIRNILQGKDK